VKSSYDVVICGAGIAGTAAAYHLAVRRGLRRILVVDALDPLTLTSDKGTQGYRNWWPGPDATMLRFVSRSIDIMEELARESGNAIRMSRRGYLFVTATEDGATRLRTTAAEVSAFGMGETREHPREDPYIAAAPEGFQGAPVGADILRGEAAIAAFPYLNPGTHTVLHLRRAGWLSAVALGTWSLVRAVSAGAEFVRDSVVGIRTAGGRVTGVQLAGGGEVSTNRVVIAAGPRLHECARMLDVQLPLLHELHAKVTFRDTAGALPRSAPFLIWTDPMALDWSSEERQRLSQQEEDQRLLGEMPGGVHVRPVDGPHGDELYLIWTYEDARRAPVWPPRYSPTYAAAVMRAAGTMVPALQRYSRDAELGFVDGGYYCKTPENRPLVGPLPVDGAFVCGALSGWGVMAAHGAGDLIAAHVAQAALPDYARWFVPSRYEDPAYAKLVEQWGANTGQL
jgi:glycine/D-amino acid oxidase-like deaminating enzyme